MLLCHYWQSPPLRAHLNSCNKMSKLSLREISLTQIACLVVPRFKCRNGKRSFQLFSKMMSTSSHGCSSGMQSAQTSKPRHKMIWNSSKKRTKAELNFWKYLTVNGTSQFWSFITSLTWASHHDKGNQIIFERFVRK